MKKSIILIFLTAWSFASFAQGRNTNTFEDPLYHPTPVRSSSNVDLADSSSIKSKKNKKDTETQILDVSEELGKYNLVIDYGKQWNESKLHWQKVYEYNGTLAEIKTHLFRGDKPLKFTLETETSISGNIIACKSKASELDIKTAIAQYDFYGKFTVDFKEGKYRVTVFDIIIRNPFSSMNLSFYLSDYILNDKYELKKNMTLHKNYGGVTMAFEMADVGDYTLSKLFHIEETKNDW